MENNQTSNILRQWDTGGLQQRILIDMGLLHGVGVPTTQVQVYSAVIARQVMGILFVV
jgi:hypothetical protein